jgi:carboxypeptidase Taq
MTDAQESYDTLVAELREIALLGSIQSILGWDERTQLPPLGSELRASQSSMLATMIHERFSSPKIDELLRHVESSPLGNASDTIESANVREVRRSYDRARKLLASLVAEQTRVAVLAQQAWGEARAKSDYPAFLPWLKQIIQLKRQEAQCVGYKAEMYDALLDEFEPGETAANLRLTFARLREPLVELIGKIVSSGRQAPLEILERSYPVEVQSSFVREAAKTVGFNFDAGRLDISLHPFCSGIGPGDTRMTTRYGPRDFSNSFFGVLHESGHALYDQGLNKDFFGTPCGEAVSLGIHESQSRLWENFVGRSHPFWQFFLPQARAAFPEALTGVSDDDWYFAINDIRHSLIRTEADEATYNLHVLLRFEIEQALLNEELSPVDLPAAWNQKMQQYFGLTVPDDAHGCLQDIHWSGGAIGYFPTYTLGNLYAAQFFEQAGRDIPGLSSQFSRGEFAGLLEWLRRNIHQHGKRYRAGELVRRITGKPLSAEPLLNHLKTKAALYGVE